MFEDAVCVAGGVVLGAIVAALANRGTKSRNEQLQADKDYALRKLDAANDWIRSKFGAGAGPAQ